MRTFMELLKNEEAGEYVEHLLACLAAPTIKGLKPGSLVNLRRHGDRGVIAAWNEKKDELLRKLGVEAFAFPPCSRGARVRESVLLLLYKRDLLTRTLLSQEAENILAPLGYDLRSSNVSLNSWLKYLTRRFDSGFPHEIGLFLGYPAEDVRGFIQHRGRNFLAVGYWKVYGDVKGAKRAFQKFKRAEHDAARAFIRQSRKESPRSPPTLSA